MAFLFKRNPKTPQELVRAISDLVAKLDTGDKKNQDESARYLSQARNLLHGDDDNDPKPDQISAFAQETYASNLLYQLISQLSKLDFDARKDVVIVFLTLLRRNIGSCSPTVDYLLAHPEILILLIKAPETEAIGLIGGQILRDCLKFESINQYVLYSPLFWNYFQYVRISIFELAMDTFSTLHDALTSHKKLVSEFLDLHYSQFTSQMNSLVQTGNYVTKRQSVRLLAELVLQRQDQLFLNRYFDDPNNLKLIMMLMGDKLKNLQIEGFHIFKFFVAKPKKSQKVLDILTKNRGNFLTFFETFNVKSNDPNLVDERDYILSEIQKLPERSR